MLFWMFPHPDLFSHSIPQYYRVITKHPVLLVKSVCRTSNNRLECETWHFHNGQYERVQITITTMWICYCVGGTINAAYCCINLKRILIYTAFKCETVYFFLILVDRSTVRFKYLHIPLCFIVRDADGFIGPSFLRKHQHNLKNQLLDVHLYIA